MIRSQLVLIAIRSAKVLACACACLLFLSQSATGESKIAIHKKFIPKSYNWDSIRRIAILPIAQAEEEAIAPGTKRKWTEPRPFPPDSVIQPMVAEMVRKIKRLDSTIVVLLIDPMADPLPEEMFIKVAGNTTRSDAVMTIRVTEVTYNGASPVIPGPYVNGSQLPSMGGRSASTRVRMNFALQDVETSSVIWMIDAEGKESRGGVGGSPDETDPPSPEGVIQDLVITAASWLPF